jgi:hypothetical protein
MFATLPKVPLCDIAEGASGVKELLRSDDSLGLDKGVAVVLIVVVVVA